MSAARNVSPPEENGKQILVRLITEAIVANAPQLALHAVESYQRERGGEPLQLARATLAEREERMRQLLHGFDPKTESARAFARRVSAANKGNPTVRHIMRCIGKAQKAAG